MLLVMCPECNINILTHFVVLVNLYHAMIRYFRRVLCMSIRWLVYGQYIPPLYGEPVEVSSSQIVRYY